jgi:hypothetical protein
VMGWVVLTFIVALMIAGLILAAADWFENG